MEPWGGAPLRAAPAPAAPAPSSSVGRIGLFVAGYFALGFAWGAYRLAYGIVGDVELVLAVVTGALAVGMLRVAEETRRTELEPLGIMAAFGSTLYVALTAEHLASATGADGDLLFWSVVVVVVPASIATLLWLPHPILGLNVAVAAALLSVRAPVGDGGLSEVGGKALLLAFILAALAVTVDLRTRSRAGSLLHYTAVAVLAFAKLIVGIELHALTGGGVLAILALGELGLALMLRRRSWAVTGWVTLVLAALIVLGASTTAAIFGSLTAAVVAVPLGWVALTVQRHGEELRAEVLASLPAELAEAFPA